MLGDLENERSERNGVLVNFDYAIKKLSDRIAASAERTVCALAVVHFENEYLLCLP